jgi:hypothetical protein
MELGEMGQTNDRTGINFGFEQDKFYIQYDSCDRLVGNLRQEFELRARELHNLNRKLILGLSAGLDSQSVLHSFFSQGLNIDCAFLYQPGYNDIEYKNIKFLEKKYGFKTMVVDIDPIKERERVMHLHQHLTLPPNQILHMIFLERLPKDASILQGIHGPDFLRYNDEWYVFESANSFEISRLRAFLTVERNGKILGFERTPEILLSLLNDDIVTAFLYAHRYIENNKLIYQNGESIPKIDYWDLYLKPFFYGKYWKDEIEYFPKYQGCENIDYIVNGPKNQYTKNLVAIPYHDLINFLRSGDKKKKVFYEYQ